MRQRTSLGFAVLAVLLVTLLGATGAIDANPVAKSPTGDVDQRLAVFAPAPERDFLLGDPDLEPGFPVQTDHSGGTYHAGAAIHTCVADIDSDSEPEIVVTALARGPVYAWNSNGSPVNGWPVPWLGTAGYPAIGSMGGVATRLEIFAGYFGGELYGYSASGVTLAGWPRWAANYVTTPAALGDVDGDGLDEIFIGEEDWKIHGYRSDGTILQGWPAAPFLGGQEIHTPALGDIDGDGDLEIVSGSGSTTPGVYLFAHHHDGSEVDGFPLLLPKGNVDTFAAIGDVDGDFAPEIVVVAKESSYPWRALVTVVAANGTVERSWFAAASVPYSTAPALADLDGDAIPEIIVQTEETLEVWDGQGNLLPGWPVWWTSRWLGNSSPVVGDVDGDLSPDIVVTTQDAGSSVGGEVWAFDRAGGSVAGFPKSLPLGSGAVPAIADIDLDGRNEIVVTGSYWNGMTGSYDKVWAFDLSGAAHGPVQWGQFGKDARHTGFFATRPLLSVSKEELSWTAVDAVETYDVVEGDLLLLLATNGDYTAATLDCLAEDVASLAIAHSNDPQPGEGSWLLVRPSGSLGDGTYDSGGPAQAVARDTGINASPAACGTP